MSTDPFPPDDQWTEGVFFGLDEERYHNLPWLGSTDMKRLAISPPDYWHLSAMNPNPPEPPAVSPAKMIGQAIHARVLHGLEAFEDRYDAVLSETGESVSAKGYQLYIKSQKGEPAGLKADQISYVKEQYGKELLSKPTYQRIIDSVDHILQNDAIRNSFQNGWPEVSIFWRQEAIPCKARIDYLKLASCIDLKSIRAHERLKDFERICMDAIWNNLYECQAAHYLDGRTAVRNLVRAGRVFGTTRPDPQWLEQCFGNLKPGWVFVFFKMDGAPMACGIQDHYEGVFHDRGRSYTRRALTNFQAYFERYGRNRWVSNEPITTVSREDEPRW